MGPIDTVKGKIREIAEEKELKQKLIDFGDTAVQKLLKGISSRISDKTIPYLNRYDNTGFMEGSGYFLSEPKEGAFWSAGFAKDSIMPERVDGELYLAGYLSFPPNRASGVISEQMIRAFAFDDGSDRGINVFAVIDCVGISNYDIRVIRNRLHDLIEEKNIVSINISATHCHSGADTQGVWGDLIEALKKNPKAVKHEKTLKDAVSGRNPDFMEYLCVTAANVITKAVNGMEKGRLFKALLPCEQFVRDKRPPYVTDNVMTVLRFEPENNSSKKLLAVFMAAHPTNYGPKQRIISCDFPYYICDELENAGYEAAYFQGAEAAVATDRGKYCEPGDSRHAGIAHYGRAIAKYILEADESSFTKVEPMLNVIVKETLIPVDNALMELLGKMRLVSNNVVKVTNGDDGKNYDYYFPTEIGLAEFGKDLVFALIPGELMPEIAYGGAYDENESYKKTKWDYPALKDVVKGRLTVIGLCNDAIAYIVPDNDFGSVFAPLHYEEAVSAGSRTGSNIAGAFIRTAEAAEKIRT
ncbi:MAG: hypothetical protein IJS90_02445 [Clostridia bacterium]|nr:hypothetical protein [Clostridia bacterium]